MAKNSAFLPYKSFYCQLAIMPLILFQILTFMVNIQPPPFRFSTPSREASPERDIRQYRNSWAPNKSEGILHSCKYTGKIGGKERWPPILSKLNRKDFMLSFTKLKNRTMHYVSNLLNRCFMCHSKSTRSPKSMLDLT